MDSPLLQEVAAGGNKPPTLLTTMPLHMGTLTFLRGLYDTYSHKSPRMIKVAICNHQADSPHYVSPDV